MIHTGIEVGVEDGERVHERDVRVCVTVEGNTSDDGSSNRNTTLRTVRTEVAPLFRTAKRRALCRFAGCYAATGSGSDGWDEKATAGLWSARLEWERRVL